ncbi:MAG: hypothetical protein LBV00_06490 [Propionibacteriaceae bacterium]|jgi:hypothetical protein|nr:hypothetical protein [Propionibacteriaceae bacterium]
MADSGRGRQFELSEVVAPWVASFLVAVGCFILSVATTQALEVIRGNSIDLTWRAVRAVWVEMARPEPWPMIGTLIGLFMVPVTFFLAIAVAGSLREAPSKAKDAGSNLLFYSSFFVAVIAWLSLPSLARPHTAGLCVLAVGLVTIGATSLNRFAEPTTTLLNRKRRDLAEHIEGLRRALDRRYTSRRHPVRPANYPVGLKTLGWASVVIIPLVLAEAWLLALNWRFPESERDLLTPVILVAALVFLSIITTLLLRGVETWGNAADKWQNAGAWCLLALFALGLISLGFFVFIGISETAVGAWTWAGISGTPIIGPLLVWLVNRSWFEHYHLAKNTARLAECEREYAATTRLSSA